MINKHLTTFLFLLLAASLPALLPPRQGSVQAVTFDETGPELITLGNSYYEIGFRKTNGAIAYIIDKATGQPVTDGSRNECLWGAYREAGGYIGGCNYSVAGPNRFSYTWSAGERSLSLNYSPDPAAGQRVTAQAVVTASEEPWFDLSLELQNDWGETLDYILFPSELRFQEADLQELLLPALPGAAVGPAFFEQDRSYVAKYPGDWFADYVAISSVKGELALYSLYSQGPIRPVFLGFTHDEAGLNDTGYYDHTFAARLEDGEEWHSPPVRIRISQPPAETIEAYRLDNGLDRFRSLPQKLGRYYAPVSQAPLYKADVTQLARPFSEYPALLAHVPAPGLLHPVGFHPGGFDENYPDFLPPAANWGTTAELAAMFQQAQAMNFLVMPYTNPTWWDDQSPTLQALPPPLTIDSIALFDQPGAARYESYGSHGGYVVSPYAPFVQQRLRQLNEAMTLEVPSSLIFEDQIGARPWLFDHNPASPGPTAYPQGWLDHTRSYSQSLLMTEKGFDRLAETEAGFHGSILLAERFGETAASLGTGTWQPYPLAPLMARDKTLFYQHDLAPETFTKDRPTLLWNMAFGYMLSYDLYESRQGGGLNSPWLSLVAAFQKQVISRYAAERMTGFSRLPEGVTESVFETFSVVSNWNQSSPYPVGPHTLPPLGFAAMQNDGSVTGGLFAAYNDAPLSSGDHYIIEVRGSGGIIVRQPVGTTTDLTIRLLPDWHAVDRLEVQAFSRDNRFIAAVPASVGSNGLTFSYQNRVEGQNVAYYRICQVCYSSFEPAIVK